MYITSRLYNLTVLYMMQATCQPPCQSTTASERTAATSNGFPVSRSELSHIDRPRILDAACGAGVGLVRLAEAYPSATLVGADGDAFSLELAAERLRRHGFEDRVELVHTPLEDLDRTDEFDLVVNNISMHECRDIEQVTRNTTRALKPGGFFVISDFPFPDTDHALRTVPGRIMSGIQFFEAQIDDQLLPVSTYLELLARHGYGNVGSFELTPVHAVTYGQK
jgi:SAM-dependent methyltransferase